jgi:hypothetical protein
VGVVGGFRSAAAEAGEIASARTMTTTRSAVADNLDNFLLYMLFTPYSSKTDPHRAIAGLYS